MLSLFDGSGGFSLAGDLCGITPVLASEIKPYPIAVTSSRFSTLKHFGDVIEVKGNKIEPVDVITFGSPCTNLSIAGNRKGLAGEQSGLFYEAIRVIKEMREATNGKYPRFIVWENVFGAYSSNRGADFRAVLESIINIVEENAVMPPIPKAGWAFADCYCGDGWSLAYRTFDAQYWGVPQRRRRIYLVADFGGQCAKEILFEREGLCRSVAESIRAWQGDKTNTEKSVGRTDGVDVCELNNKIAGTLDASYYKGCGMRAGVERELIVDQVSIHYAVENHPHDSRVKLDESGKIQTLTNRMGTGGNNVPLVMESIVFALDRASFNQGKNAKYDFEITEDGINSTLVAKGASAVAHKEGSRYIVRRLTPSECAKLQGFPSDWGQLDVKTEFTDTQYEFWKKVRNDYASITNKTVRDYTRQQMLDWYNKLHSDSAEYEMWGNGIALPNALYVMEGIAKVLKEGGATDE